MEIKLKCNDSENWIGIYGSYTEEEVNLFMYAIDCCRFTDKNQVRINLSNFSMTQATFDYDGFFEATLEEMEEADSVSYIRVFGKVFVSEDFFEITFSEWFLDFINSIYMNIKIVDEPINVLM